MADDGGAARPGQTPGGGWVPIPDPTTLTESAIARATDVFRRELAGLRETIETRLDAADQDRGRLWQRVRDLPALYETAASHLRDELIQRDAHTREVLVQRLNDLDDAAKIAASHIEKIPLDLAGDFQRALRSEREYTMSQIDLARAETKRTGDVAEERFGAIDGLFNSNDKALTAALAAQEKAAAEQQKSNTLAIDKSEKTTQETIKANDAKTASSIQAQSDTISDLKERVVRIESGGAAIGAARHEQRSDDTFTQTDRIAQQAADRAAQAAVQARVSLAIGALGVLAAIIAVLFTAFHH
jgi:hypothetical protein